MLNNFLKAVFIFLLSLSLTSCNNSVSSESNQCLDPSKMTKEDYRDIDFRDMVDGVVKEREKNDVSTVTVSNDRQELDDEVKVAVYIYHDDIFEEAKYQYLKKGEDYRFYPFSSNRIDTSIEEDNLLTGVGNSPVIYGMYTDSSFSTLIESNKLQSISNDLKEIHVRRVSVRYVYNYFFEGTYKDGDFIVTFSNSICEFTYSNVSYKIIGQYNEYPGFTIKELYIDGEKIENLENYNFGINFASSNLYSMVYISLDVWDGEKVSDSGTKIFDTIISKSFCASTDSYSLITY